MAECTPVSLLMGSKIADMAYISALPITGWLTKLKIGSYLK